MKWIVATLYYTLLVVASIEGVESNHINGLQSEPAATATVTQVTVPEPINLQQGWWKYFKVEPHLLKERIEVFSESLQKDRTTISEDNKEKVNSLIDKITHNLISYEYLVQNKIPEEIHTNPIASSYTLNNLIDLNMQIRKETIESQAEKAEIEDKAKAINTLQNKLAELQNKYKASQERSEDKLITGLEIIENKVLLELNLKQKNWLQKKNNLEDKYLTSLNDEMEKARSLLTITTGEMSKLDQKLKRRQRLWNIAQEELYNKEAEAAAVTLPPEDKLSEMEQQQQNMELIQTSIQEAIAHDNYLNSVISKEIAQTIINSDLIDSDEQMRQIKERQDQILTMELQAQEWLTIVERQSIRNTQRLFLFQQNEEEEENALTKIYSQILQTIQNNRILIQQLKNQLENSKFLIDILEFELAKAFGGHPWYQQLYEFIAKGAANTGAFINKPLFSVTDSPITLLSILNFSFIIALALWLGRLLLRTMEGVAATRKKVERSLIYRLTRLFYYLILISGFLIGLSWLGFDFSNLLLVAGALGVGLGFGLQSIFNNFISGIIILFENELNIGDYIEVTTATGSLKGEIREVNFRSTIINTNNGSDVLVPNSELLSNKVINWTLRDPYRIVCVPFTVSYDSDKNIVAKVVKEAAKNVPCTLNKIGVPEPDVLMKKLGDYGLEFELVTWVDEKSAKSPGSTLSQYLWAIEEALKNNKITIPCPKQELVIMQTKTT